MQQIYGAKVSVLTWGGLADNLAKTRNPYSDVCLNCQKSAEVILPAKVGKDQTIGGYLKFEVHEEIR